MASRPDRKTTEGALVWRLLWGAVLLLGLVHLLVPAITAVAIALPNPFKAFADYGSPEDFGLQLAPVSAPGVVGWLAEPDDPRGTALLCHGRSRRKSHLLPLTRRLVAEGWRVLAIDFRGHGDRPYGTTTIGLREAADVTAALHWIEAHAGGPVVVYGVSMGGAAVLRALGEGSHQRVAAAAIDGSFPDLAALLRHNGSRWPGPGYLVAWGVALAGAWAGYEPSTVRPVEAVPRVQAPMLFLEGTDDALVPPGSASTLAAAGGDHARLAYYPGGHDEAGNAAMHDLVASFFASAAPPRSTVSRDVPPHR